jgi:apolipoprotein N-acyltransferase
VPQYDKIHLVPFGEFIPFKDSLPFLYRLFLWLSPYTDDYTLAAGDQLTVFQISDGAAHSWRAVTPICFEDIVPPLVAEMFRGDNGAKRADVIVNLTNDGWFRGGEQPEHLKTAVFRSIENRAPTARSVNTGISGFIDSVGHVTDTVAAGTHGWSVKQLGIDPRVTFYTRHGDVFAITCVVISFGYVLFVIVRSRKRTNEPTH